MHILGAILIGFVVGLIARAVTPGPGPRGFILTTVLGVVGATCPTQRGVVDLAVDLDLEALPLTNREALEAQPLQGTGDGLALRVEDFGLGHDVDDDA